MRGAAAVGALLEHIYNPVLTHPKQFRHRFDFVTTLADRVAIFGAPPRSLAAEQVESLVWGDVG